MSADGGQIGENLETAAVDVLDTPDAGPMIVRGSALRLAGYGAGVLVSVAAAAVLIRHLGAGGFGGYVTVTSLVTLIGGFTEAGMTNIAIREYTIHEPPFRDRLMASLLGLRLVLTLAGVIGATVFALIAGYASPLVAGTVAAGFGLVFVILQNTIAVPLSTGLRLGYVSLLDLLRLVVTLILTILLVLAGAGVFSFLAITIPVGILILAVTIPLVRGHFPLLPSFDRAEWGRLLKITLPFAVATAVGTAYAYITVILMSLISTAQETGYFGASFRVFIVLTGVPMLLMTSAFPVLARAARDDAARLRYGVRRLFDVSLTIGAGTAIVTAIGAPVAIDVVAGSGFDPSVAVLRIQAVALLGTFLAALWSFALLSLHRHAALLIANAIVLVVSIVLTLVLVPAAGAEGAATANVVGESVLAAAYAFFLFRFRPDLRASLRIVPRVGLAAALAVVPALFLPLPALPMACLAGAIYVLALALLRAIPPEVVHLVELRERLSKQ